MALTYKINVLKALKESGYNTNTIKLNKLLPQSTLQKLRTNKPISWKSIETICKLLRKQPNYFLEYRDDEKENSESKE